jgi:hypothetical protein
MEWSRNFWSRELFLQSLQMTKWHPLSPHWFWNGNSRTIWHRYERKSSRYLIFVFLHVDCNYRSCYLAEKWTVKIYISEFFAWWMCENYPESRFSLNWLDSLRALKHSRLFKKRNTMEENWERKFAFHWPYQRISSYFLLTAPRNSWNLGWIALPRAALHLKLKGVSVKYDHWRRAEIQPRQELWADATFGALNFRHFGVRPLPDERSERGQIKMLHEPIKQIGPSRSEINFWFDGESRHGANPGRQSFSSQKYFNFDRVIHVSVAWDRRSFRWDRLIRDWKLK